ATRVRFHVALALGDRDRHHPDALKALARIAARDASDPWMRLAILSGLAESATAFLPHCIGIAPSEGRSELLAQCAAIVGARHRDAELASVIGTIADQSRDHPSDAMTLLAGLADGLERAGKPLHTMVVKPPAELTKSFEQ